jgi:hypothetical protein
MPITIRKPGEPYDTFLVRGIRDDEAEACIEIAISTEATLVAAGHESAGQIVWAICKAIQDRIHGRAETSSEAS